jgi:hypothetical protein
MKMLPGCMSAWKKPSRKTWVKKISTPARDSAGRSMPAAISAVGLTDRDAPHALHDHHRRRALIPVHFGHLQQPRTAEVAPQLRAVGSFAHQVEFVVEILGELADDFARLQPLAVRPDLFEQTGEGVEQGQIAGDDAVHAGAKDLDRDLVAPVLGSQAGEMDLGDRGAGHRRRIEFGKDLARRPAIGLLDLRQGERRRERRHAVLQLREFVGEVGRQQIATSGHHLPELDEDRPQRLEREAQTDRRRGIEASPEMHDARDSRQPAAGLVFENHLVDAVAARNTEDFGEAEKAHGRRRLGGRQRRQFTQKRPRSPRIVRPGFGRASYNPPLEPILLIQTSR